MRFIGLKGMIFGAIAMILAGVGTAIMIYDFVTPVIAGPEDGGPKPKDTDGLVNSAIGF